MRVVSNIERDWKVMELVDEVTYIIILCRYISGGVYLCSAEGLSILLLSVLSLM